MKRKVVVEEKRGCSRRLQLNKLRHPGSWQRRRGSVEVMLGELQEQEQERLERDYPPSKHQFLIKARAASFPPWRG